MKERPILFSAPMVRALLDGSKTQTRRVVKPTPAVDQNLSLAVGSGGFHFVVDQSPIDYPNLRRIRWDCPYGQPGDRLWVKETTVNVEDFGYLGPVWVESEHGQTVLEYGLAPSEYDCTEVEPEDLKLRPSIFMSRAMSRIMLEITRVCVERLQDISEADAAAEGVTAGKYAGLDQANARTYSELWESINGPNSWDLNPWVWVIEFKKATP